MEPLLPSKRQQGLEIKSKECEVNFLGSNPTLPLPGCTEHCTKTLTCLVPLSVKWEWWQYPHHGVAVRSNWVDAFYMDFVWLEQSLTQKLTYKHLLLLFTSPLSLLFCFFALCLLGRKTTSPSLSLKRSTMTKSMTPAILAFVYYLKPVVSNHPISKYFLSINQNTCIYIFMKYWQALLSLINISKHSAHTEGDSLLVIMDINPYFK